MEEKRYQYYFDDEYYLLSYVHDVYSYRYHWHDDIYELHITLTDNMEFIWEEQGYFLQPDDVVIISPGIGHATLALEPQTAALVLRFSANAFEEFPQQDYICRFNFVSDSFDRQTVHYTHVRLYCMMLLQALTTDDAYTGEIVRPAFELLLATFFSRFESERNDTHQPKNKNIPDQLIQDVIQYIDENYAKKVSLGELTGQFSYNRTYISVFFKKNMGVKFYGYLTRTRFSAAVWDLATTDLSPAKIALYNGSPDLKTFNHLFQGMFRITPTEYRQKLAVTLTKLSNGYWSVKELSDPNIKLKLDEFIGTAWSERSHMNTLSRNWKKNFFTIRTGRALPQFSSSILQFVIVWYLTNKTGSTMVLTTAMIMGFLPQGILGPSIGVFIDRYNRKRIMIVSDLFIPAASFIMVMAGWMGGLTTELILVVLLLRSVGPAFYIPRLQAVTPQIVPSGQLTRRAGYSQALESVSWILSPVVTAVLYSFRSLNGTISLDVVGALIAVLTLGITEMPQLVRKDNGEKIRVLREAEEGFLILRTKRRMLGLVLIGSIYTLTLTSTNVLFPLMTMSYFRGTSTHASMVEVIFSVGLLFGSLILSKWGGTKNRIYTTVPSFLLMSFSLLISGLLLPGGFYTFVLCSWLMGVSGPFYWGMYMPLPRSNFNAEYLGRVLSLSSSIRLLSRPIGLVISGAFAENCGVEKWFPIASTPVLSASILCVTVLAMRTCDDTEARNNAHPPAKFQITG